MVAARNHFTIRQAPPPSGHEGYLSHAGWFSPSVLFVLLIRRQERRCMPICTRGTAEMVPCRICSFQARADVHSLVSGWDRVGSNRVQNMMDSLPIRARFAVLTHSEHKAYVFHSRWTLYSRVKKLLTSSLFYDATLPHHFQKILLWVPGTGRVRNPLRFDRLCPVPRVWYLYL